MPSIAVDLRDSSRQIERLVDLYRNTTDVELRYRKLLAEIAILRLSSILENTFKQVCCKIVCGASYIDGTAAQVVVPCRSIASAVSVMQTHNRPRPRELKWTGTSDIKDNLRYVVEPTDHAIKVFENHGTFLSELNRVRNRIAHNNAAARKKFKLIVMRHYGAELNWVTPGTLLLSTRRTPPLMEQYLARSQVLLRILVKA